MKKSTSLFLAVFISISFAGCQSKQQMTNVPPATESSNQVAMESSLQASSTASAATQAETKITDAKSVADALKAKGLPISSIIVYTEETDVNKLLGRPNQYTSKVNFADSRAEQIDKENPVGGSVEVFDNQKDAKSRYDYVDSIVKNGGSTFAQYLYLNGKALLRIDGALTPSQAKEYQSAFTEIMK